MGERLFGVDPFADEGELGEAEKRLQEELDQELPGGGTVTTKNDGTVTPKDDGAVTPKEKKSHLDDDGLGGALGRDGFMEEKPVLRPEPKPVTGGL